MAKVIKRPLYTSIDGIIVPSMLSPKCFKEALTYKAQPDDTFIVTYPKCGTTWMQNVALYIFRKGRELEDPSLFYKYCPFIDMCGLESIDKMPRPGSFKTHLPFAHLPYSSKSKYVFVARNPKDCCVSFYHHVRNHPGFGFWDAEFDDFFELFMAGDLEFNEYFDHLLSWYPHRNDSNVFYTTYEDMKRDMRDIVVRLATFLGKEYIEAIEMDNSVLNNIILYSSFDYMRKNYCRASIQYEKNTKEPETYEGLKYIADFVATLDVPKDIRKEHFIRKGLVGDWKNVLNDEQNERLTQKYLEKTRGTEIPNWFPDVIQK